MKNVDANDLASRWSSESPRVVSPDCQLWSAPGDSVHMVKMRLTAGASFAAHSHPHEQMTYLLEGEMVFVVEGEPVRLYAGDCIRIPSGTMHGASVIGLDDAVTVEVFAPVREDLI